MASSSKFSKELRDLLLALVLTLIGLGYSVSGLPASIVVGCVIWAAAWLCVCHLFWISEWTETCPIDVKVVLLGTATFFIVLVLWSPVQTEYAKEHPVPKKEQPDPNLAPAGFVSFLGTVVNGYAPMMQENQTETPLDDVHISVTGVVPKQPDPKTDNEWGTGAVVWQKEIDIGICRARLTSGLSERFPIQGERLWFYLFILTRFQTYRETMKLSKVDADHYQGQLAFYGGAGTKPIYTRPVSLLVQTIASHGHAAPKEKQPTMKSLMEGWLPNDARVFARPDVGFSDGFKLTIEDVLYLDFPGGSKSTGFYIPSSPRTYDLAMALAPNARKLSDDLVAQFKLVGKSPGENPQSVDSLVHTGRIFLYHDDFMTKRQEADVEEAFAKQRLDVVLRGPDYLTSALVEWQRKQDEKKRH